MLQQLENRFGLGEISRHTSTGIPPDDADTEGESE